ncbi:Uncharacterised protein [Mycobacteroides abscessus subsp. abscessus]|nr:Uncharacterised protein [Mycobacteroides abscessus subsp. abscessus]
MSIGATLWRTAFNAGFSSTPLPRVLTTVMFPREMASTSPATPRRELVRRSSGSQKEASTRRSSTSTRLYLPSERM